MYEGPRLSHMLAKHIFLYPYLSKKLGKLVGFQDPNYLWYSDTHENLHGGFYNETDMKQAKERGIIFFKNAKKFQEWIKQQDKLHKKTKNIMHNFQIEKKIDKIKKKDILSLIPELSRIRSELFIYVLACQPQCTEGLSDELKQIISSKVKDAMLAKEAFITLTMPEKQLFFTDEEIDWLRIVIKGKEYGMKSYDPANKQFKEIHTLIKQHYDKYFIIPASDRTEAWDINHFIGLFNHSMKSDEDFVKKKETLTLQYKNVNETKKELLKKYELPEEAREIGSLVADIGHYRFLSSFYGRWIGYYLVLICRRYSKKTGFTFEELSSCEEEELISIIRNQAIISKEELENRANAETILIRNNHVYLYFGEMAKQIKQQELKGIDYANITEIKGEIANLGKATGKAFVFYWNDDINKKIHKVPKNCILVAPQTHPIYMPAIRKAKALATDEGGITGHAAIVSRELGKPCVIGLHHITKVVKTGDLIELDGDNGIIRIIKRA